MKFLRLKQSWILLVGLSLGMTDVTVIAATAEASKVFPSIASSQHKLILSPEQRQKIDQERVRYLRSLSGHVEEAPFVTKPTKKKKRKRVVRYVLQSVIVNAQGESLIQLNNRWFKQQNAPIHFKVDPNNPAVVHMKVGKNRFIVPVGATLLLQKNKIFWQSNIKIDSK